MRDETVCVCLLKHVHKSFNIKHVHTSLIMISEEQWRNDEISFQMRIREVLIAKYVPDILVHASPCILTENIMLQFLKKKMWYSSNS